MSNSIMMKYTLSTLVRLASLLCFGAAAGAQDKAINDEIRNEFLHVNWDRATGSFSARAMPSGKLFANAMKTNAGKGTVKKIVVTDRTFGTGDALEVTGSDHNRDVVMLFPRLPFVLVRSTLHNRGEKLTTVRSIRPLSVVLDLGLPASALRTLGTGGLFAADENPGSYAWLAVADPTTRRGVVGGWLTHDRGSGVVRSQVDARRATLGAQVDYGRLTIAPAEDATLETFALGYFDDARIGMEAWAAAVARVYAIKLPPQPVGYCTWYHARASNARQLAQQTAFAARELAPFGFSVVQIDDGWQAGVSGGNGPDKVFIDYNPEGPYPAGMKAAALDIKAHGLRPGLWFMPFAGTWSDPFFKNHQDWFVKHDDGKPYDTAWGGTCLDMTNPAARDYLRSVVQRITGDWGETYLKMDGMWTGTASKQIYVNSGYQDEGIGDAVFHDPRMTNIEAYRSGLKLIRETAGDRVFLLGCCAPQNMRSYGGAFGMVDAMRIGPDNGPGWDSMRVGPLFASRNYHLHGRIWFNDPDPLYVRPSVPIDQARFLCSWVTVSGSLNVCSDFLPDLPADRLAILKRTMPSHGLLPRPVDLFETEPARIWLLTDERRTPRRDIVALYNWDDKSLTVDVPMDRVGLPPAVVYVAFDFWANTFIPPFRDRLKTTLPPRSCQILAVRPLLNRPFLISTSRHIAQGMVDVKEENWDGATTLSGTSEVVAGDPYELRVIAPPESKGWTAVRAEIAADDRSAGASMELAQSGPYIRAAIRSSTSRTVNWRIVFEPGLALDSAPTRVTNLNATSRPFDRSVVLAWEAAEGPFRVTRQDGQSFHVATKSFTDDSVQQGATYNYVVNAVGWSGASLTGASIAVTVPSLAVPPTPRAPDVDLTTLTPTRATIGWGKIGINKSASGGPLLVNGKRYKQGLGVHAASELIYICKLEYSRLVATAGLDDEKRSDDRSSVIFQVYADETLLAASPTLTWKTVSHWNFDAPIPSGTKHLRLVVTDAGDGIAADHADWVNAGFIVKGR
jgi:NPCBM/NEW2 domain/Melibiase